MSKVYLVSKGTYSDFSIIAAFATRELAESFASMTPGKGDVLEYDLLETLPSRVTIYRVADDNRGEWSFQCWDFEAAEYLAWPVNPAPAGTRLGTMASALDPSEARRLLDDAIAVAR